ncbi:MAG: 2-amino-4-hydroxy-6-hydroxymethyldihydropteridine diphosphokinase [Actinomycetaceae bacterium]|nr:2-amino-4-hydroxy-6-hydroxymethyldihydropteridine diphosphokinase [Actinomycetaceae bacterium]MDY6083492.1 2-amino-4-hydroxy-6-hydroxymethyldihydropteridine diphosphokinase [Actinomycetaceae bacterium]
MIDSITVKGITAFGFHGVLPEETKLGQVFSADVSYGVETADAAAADDLSATISYADVVDAVRSVLAGSPMRLLETVAARIAGAVLGLGALWVDVTIHKPHAPVGYPVDDVQLHIFRPGFFVDKEAGIHHVVLGLGANLGDRDEQLRWAVRQIRTLPVHVTAVSDIVHSAPQLEDGQDPQPDFSNAVLALDTALAPYDLLDALQQIEVRGGRVRHEHWGARLLDIDVIDIDGKVASSQRLTLPHPMAARRWFVLEPWLQIEPDAVLAGVPVTTIVDDLHRSGAREHGVL